MMMVSRKENKPLSREARTQVERKLKENMGREET